MAWHHRSSVNTSKPPWTLGPTASTRIFRITVPPVREPGEHRLDLRHFGHVRDQSHGVRTAPLRQVLDRTVEVFGRTADDGDPGTVIGETAGAAWPIPRLPPITTALTSESPRSMAHLNLPSLFRQPSRTHYYICYGIWIWTRPRPQRPPCRKSHGCAGRTRNWIPTGKVDRTVDRRHARERAFHEAVTGNFERRPVARGPRIRGIDLDGGAQ
jgi:hypothetical protein